MQFPLKKIEFKVKKKRRNMNAKVVQRARCYASPRYKTARPLTLYNEPHLYGQPVHKGHTPAPAPPAPEPAAPAPRAHWLEPGRFMGNPQALTASRRNKRVSCPKPLLSAAVNALSQSKSLARSGAEQVKAAC